MAAAGLVKSGLCCSTIVISSLLFYRYSEQRTGHALSIRHRFVEHGAPVTLQAMPFMRYMDCQGKEKYSITGWTPSAMHPDETIRRNRRCCQMFSSGLRSQWTKYISISVFPQAHIPLLQAVKESVSVDPKYRCRDSHEERNSCPTRNLPSSADRSTASTK